VKVRNTGSRDADEVIQIYVSKDDKAADDPAFSLRAFKRVSIPAGKTVSAEFELPAGAFESVNDAGDSVLVPGSYTVIAADAAPLSVSTEKGAPAPVSAKIRVV
jgi:beta-glucosidase